MSNSPSQYSYSSQSSVYSDDDITNGIYFDDVYDMSVFLYKGQFGDTYRCIERESGNKYAVKILPKAGTGYENSGVRFSREGTIWRRLKHKNVIELVRIFNTPKEQFLVTEFVKDGKLFDQLPSYTTYTERDAAFFMKQLFEGLSYLRKRRVVHRCLTTENIWLKQSDYGEVLKIGDFSLSLRLERGQKYTKVEPQGMPLFLAPEVILEHPINYGVDTWAAGVVLYILLVGYPPFWNDRLEVMYGDILTRPADLSSALWNGVSNEAKDLLEKLLDKNMNTRLNADKALAHDWFKENNVAPRDHKFKTIDKLKELNGRRKARNTMFTIQTVFSGEGKRAQDQNNNKTSLIQSFGGMRRKKMFEEEKRQNFLVSGDEEKRRMTVISKTKTVDLCTNTNKAKVCVQFQPKNLFVNLNTSYK
ncbi:myosin light chain kinase A-like [Clytia hemisphaerica]|uniref:myosin light chain kinase A-like n=1 Tax=Clytia hemisphaerica TaxID=252671 RepID=UPI0034D51C87